MKIKQYNEKINISINCRKALESNSGEKSQFAPHTILKNIFWLPVRL